MARDGFRCPPKKMTDYNPTLTATELTAKATQLRELANLLVSLTTDQERADYGIVGPLAGLVQDLYMDAARKA